MAEAVGKLVFKKILKENVGAKLGKGDPYFEYVPVSNPKKGKKQALKRVKKSLPPGISDHEAKILTKVKRRAYRLDNSMSIVGVKVGWSSVIGLIPGVGDFADVALALLVFKTCCQIKDLSPTVKKKMIANIVVDGAIGLLPFVGDVADTFFRCNTRNVVLLEKFLLEKYNPPAKKGSKRRQTDKLDMREQQARDGHGSPPDYETLPPNSTRDGEMRGPDRVATNKSRKSGRT